MILECYECEECFDADTCPLVCPLCGASAGFATIRITDRNGREVTYAEHISDLRSRYLRKVPEGMSRKEIESMSPSELEDLHYFMTE